MKISIIESNASTGRRETKNVEVKSEARIPVHFQGNVHISRDGEPPASVTKLADGVVVQWKDGTYVVLIPDDGSNLDQLKQVSINAVSEGAAVEEFMLWRASYDDDALDFAPLGPYGLPPADVEQEKVDLFTEPAAPPVEPVTEPPPPEVQPAIIPPPPPDLPPAAVDDTNFIVESDVTPAFALGNVLQNLVHGLHKGIGPFADVADTEPEGAALLVTLAGVQGTVGTALSSSVVTVQGQYGTLVLNADGAYIYTLNPNNPAPEALDEGESLVEAFFYTVADPSGQTASATLTITIFGTNDVPVALADTNWAQENVADASGNVLQTLPHNGAPSGAFSDIADTDVDVEPLSVGSVNGNALNVGVAVAGTYGTLTLNADGAYTYVVNPQDSTVQGLDDGETLTDVFNYTATDGDANSASATLTITIFGTNDAPIANADTNWAKEDVANASGNVLLTLAHNGAPSGAFSDIVDTDVDDEPLSVSEVNGSAGNVGAAVAGTYGSLTLNSNGTYNYALNNAHADVQKLDDGETLTDVFNYTATDGTASAGATLTITIFGTNDTPVANADTNWVQEDIVNANGNVLQTLAHNGAPSGAFSDVADTDVDDEPLSVSEVNGSAGNVGAAVAGTYGSLTLNSNGTYAYLLNNGHASVQALDDGETLTDVFNYTATDGTASAGAALTITIFGTNDAPVANADTNWAQEDGADASGNVLQTLAHNGAPSGAFSDIADTDADIEALTVSSVNGVPGNVGAAVAGTYGTLTLAATGAYSYILNDAHASVQALDEGETITDVFNYTANDGSTNSAPATLTITIFGTNDAPVANADTNWAQEDGADASGNVLQTLAHNGAPSGSFSDIADTDVDIEALTVSAVNGSGANVGSAVAGAYGTLTLGASGAYSYILNNAHASVQALDEGETITDAFTYTASDGSANSASATLTITIFGTNDAPVANADTNWAQEDGADASGNVLQTLAHNGAPSGSFSDIADTDVDIEALTVSSVNGVPGNVGAAVAGTYGTLTLAATGAYSYILNDAHAAVQALDVGETITDVFNYTANDGSTNSAPATLTITIFGTNDAPVANADTNWAQEDGADASGNVLQTLAHNGAPSGAFSDIADTDVDIEALTVSSVNGVPGNVGAAVAGTYGTLTLAATGAYSYLLNDAHAAVQALDVGETITDVFNYTASDGTANSAAATLTITIFGTNDTPVANPDTNWAQEDGADASGNVLQTLAHNGAPSGSFSDIADTDVDIEALTVSSVNGVPGNVGAAVAGTYGTLTLAASGAYSYILNDGHAAVQALDVGETITDVFNYTANDGSTNSAAATLTITIFGTNDTPVANADTNWAKEDVSDASGNVLQTLAHAGAPSGSFSDIADTDVDIETLTVNSVNGMGGNVGNAVLGTHGTLTLNGNGTYNYVLNNGSAAVQTLDDGETLTDVFNYTATDGTASAGATLTITIFGTNDAPVANADTNWAKEDVSDASGNVLQTLAHAGAPSGSFSDIADTDVDIESLTVSAVNGSGANVGSAVAGTYGTLTLGASGAYSYILNDAHASVQALDDGETLTDVFTYTATDGTANSASANLTITIFGTNDAPVANADTNWAQEDGADASGNVLQTLAHNGAPSGSFSDIADTDIDIETLTVSSVNGVPGNVGAAVAGAYGTLTLGSNGAYSYILNDAHASVQALDAGETLTDVFNYTANDGSTNSASATLTITIFGANDAPVAIADTNWAQEDGVDASGNVLQTLPHNGAPSGVFSDNADTDADAEPLTVSSVNGVPGNVGAAVAGTYGTLTLAANGAYSYILNDAHAAVQALDVGETITDVFNYTANDGSTNSAPATLTITIFGTNDAPVANADTNWAQEDVSDASGNVLQTLVHAGAPSGTFSDIADTDVDVETLTVSTVNGSAGNVGAAVAGAYGTLTLAANGAYNYILNDAHAAVQALDVGETITDVFNYTANDGTANSAAATLTITIFGTNDSPVANADTNWAKEDVANASGNVLLTLAHAGAPSGTFSDIADTDVDIETLTVNSVNGVGGNVGNAVLGTHGTLTLNGNGTYNYVLNNGSAAVQALDDGETLTDVFNYTATDGTATAGATLTITIFGTNDAPVANADTNWAQEDVSDASGNVLQTLAHAGAPSGAFSDIADTDVDVETLTVSAVNGSGANVGNAVAGTYGTLTLGASGAYSYILNDAHATVQALDDGEFITDVFTYTATDGTANSASATLTITIFGTNDAPVANADTNWAQEDGADASGNVLQTLAHNGAPSGTFGDVADTDVDVEALTVSSVNGAAGNVGNAVAGTYGTLTLGATGAYSYILNDAHAAVQALDVGETITDVFNYTANDGTANSAAATLTITIFGTNDAPVANADTNWAQEDGADASGNVLQTLAHAGAPSGSFSDIADTDVDVEMLTVSTVNGSAGNVGAAVAGTYGTLTLGANGAYSYILNDALAAVQALDVGETITDVFNYTANDGSTNSAAATLTITIFGTNDTPVANADTNWAQEDGADASGNVLQTLVHAGAPSGSFSDIADTDVDLETLTVSTVNGSAGNVGAAVAGTYGTLTLGANGAYSYILNDAHAAVQALDVGETIIDVFNYTANDGTTNSAAATLTITIFGTNDTPVANADTNWAKEDVANASGNVLLTLAHAGAPSGSFSDIADTDVDIETLTVGSVNGVAGNVGIAVLGTHGTLTLNGNGTYNYVLNNGSAAVQALDDGETLSDVFNYTATDGTASAGATLTITIFGTNDTPVANADTNWAQEDVSDASGNVLQTLAHAGAPSGSFSDIADTDVDVETLTVSAVNGSGANVGNAVAGTYGTLTLNSNGAYSYILNDAHASVQALDDGETITDIFNYTANDGTANSASATLTITIFGTNDAPVANADTNWAQEDGADASGNVLQTLPHAGAPSGSFSDIADTDVDVETLTVSTVNGSAGNVGAAVAGTYGTLTLGSNGAYSYILNDAHADVQALDVGETITDVFNYTANDGSANSAAATLTITIFGTNDAPVANADTNWAQEDVSDASGNVLQTLVHAGAPSGSFSDIADTDVDVETLTVSAVNGSGANVGIALAGTYGTLTLNGNGAYSYILNDAHATVQALDVGETITDVFNYTANDGTANSASATLTITIFGTNDAPVANADTNWAQEDVSDASGNVLQTLPHAGSLSGSFSDIADTDVDVEPLTVSTVNGSAGNVGVAIAGIYGTLTLNSNGSYNYILNDALAAVQALDVGETLSEAFTYTASDGTANSASASLTITIFGTNDAPVANADTNWAQEDGADASGNVLQTLPHAGAPSGSFSDVADTDVDIEPLTVSTVNGNAGNVGVAIAGLYGTLTLNSNGSYNYILNDAHATVQGLEAGETITDVFNYTASDGTADSASATLTITIFGSNDAPVVGTGTALVSEEGLAGANPDTVGNPTDGTNSATASGTISVSDPDGQPLTVTLVAPPLGTFTSGGVNVTWVGDGTNHLVGTVGATPIMDVVINNAGAFTVTLQGHIDHAPGDFENLFVFAFDVNVSDGITTVPTTLTVTIEDDSATAGSNAAIIVDDDDVIGAGGNPGGTGDLAPANATGTVSHSFGADGGTIAWLNTGAPVGFSYQLSGNNLLVKQGSTTVLTVNLNPTSGAYSVVQNAAILHALLANENDANFTLNYRVTDADGDFVDGSLSLTVNDDTPVSITPQTEILVNSAGASSTSSLPLPLLDGDGDVDNNMGADKPGTIAFANITNGQQATGVIGGNTVNLTSGLSGSLIKLYLVDHDSNSSTPNRLEGWVDGAPGALGATQIFNVTLNHDPTNATQDTYQVNVLNPIGATQQAVLLDFSQLGSGSQAFKVQQDPLGTNTDQDLLFSGYTRSGTGVTNIASGGSALNSSTTGIGVGNNSMNDTDNLRLDFVTAGSSSNGSNNDYDYGIHYNVNNFQFKIVQDNTSGSPTNHIEMWVRIYNADNDDPAGSSADHAVALNTGDAQLNTITALQWYDASSNTTTPLVLGSLVNDGLGGYLVTGLDVNDTLMVTASGGGFNRLEIENPISGAHGVTNAAHNGEAFDIGAFAFSANVINIPQVGMSFQVALTDADGDTTVSTNPINITLNAPVPPVALDLNGDGVHYLTHDDSMNHVRFDFNGDGAADKVSWVDHHDGILVYDRDGNHQVSSASEFVFTHGHEDAHTDMEALRMYFDDNTDGLLDSADSVFAQLGIWQDANSNGLSDAGEFHTLADAGISSISLFTDATTYTTANGEVQVHGQSVVTHTDGTTSIAQDATFSVFSQPAGGAPEGLLASDQDTVEALLPPTSPETTGPDSPEDGDSGTQDSSGSAQLAESAAATGGPVAELEAVSVPDTVAAPEDAPAAVA
ncbi:VCBS repeat-containing protein [Roseimicrobium gellanilyticum]|uniref:VCBS repeat-containing protein n=1 Tax=Roseimicrobium gellanilyticum TaxID=748857 RepID=A0A366HRZ5_9BACT|nr:VCBS domain-containing protein [Roseimicrobium gellanilyticum]RBP46029.1 VCBS repeat-containing protein [Roseimicrobium gellanilyticum]